ncbi:multidrug ABC transporter ATPase [Neobacillus drentensis]|uniref:multidrug ABC transporter ATPase n=1 Tax=Neobacillus drentensis TaxID=220684 RepID=UPI002FFEF680
MNELNKLKTKLKVEAKKNGSMTQDFDDVKKLGKEMKKAKTGTQLEEEDNKTPDPLQ